MFTILIVTSVMLGCEALTVYIIMRFSAFMVSPLVMISLARTEEGGWMSSFTYSH